MMDLKSIRMSWSITAPAGWCERIGDSGRRIGEVGAEAHVVRVGPVLHQTKRGRLVAALMVHHHGMGHEAMCSLSIGQAPEDEPPDNVRENTEKLGGARGLHDLVEASWGDGQPPVGEYCCEYKLSVEQWTHPGIPRSLDPTVDAEAGVAALGSEALVEQVGYRFVSGASGLCEVVVIFLHDIQEYLIHFNSRDVIRVTKGLVVQPAVQMEAMITAHLFQRRKK